MTLRRSWSPTRWKAPLPWRPAWPFLDQGKIIFEGTPDAFKTCDNEIIQKFLAPYLAPRKIGEITMQIHKNETATGLLVIVSALILFGVLVVLGAPGLIKPLNTYRIYYDNAGGIRPGAPVLLAGREIGKVTKMESPIALANRPPGIPRMKWRSKSS